MQPIVDEPATPVPAFSHRRHWAADQSIAFLMQQAVENQDVISLAAGLVDPKTLPIQETRAAVELMLADDQRAREVLQYGTTAGSERLRDRLLEHLAHLEHTSVSNLGIDRSQLVVTTGSQQLLSLISEVLFDPEDICLVAAPTYFVFLGTLNGVHAQTVSVSTDDNGMCPDALEKQLEHLDQTGQLDRVKLIYLVSYYENPSGISLAEERRQEIVEIAQRWSKHQRIFILEDAAYRELHYDGPELPSVWSFDDDHETVILAQTFSKSFSPGLRVGFGVLPNEMAKAICDRKGSEDFGSANFNQHLLATVFEQEHYLSHVEELCRSYRHKRDRMLDAAENYFGDLPGVTWVRPHGGLYVWMSLPERIDTGFDSSLFQRATHDEKVMYVPGNICFADPDQPNVQNHMRLSFGVQGVGGIDEGMRRLANAVRAEMDRN